MMRGKTLPAVGVMSLILIVFGSSIAMAISTDQALYRIQVRTAIRKMGNVTNIQANLCHRKRMKGQIAEAIDCNDPTVWAVQGFERGSTAVQRERDRVVARVSSCKDITDPGEFGYLACPAPCDVLPLASFGDFGVCAECVASDCIFGALADALGTPPLPLSKFARKCQLRAGRDLILFYNKMMKLQESCQFRKDVLRNGYTDADCADFDDPVHPMQAQITRIRAKLDKNIMLRCEDTDILNELDLCGVDVPSTQACLKDTVEQCIGVFFDLAYP